MAYCRTDIYAYCGGDSWVIHVAQGGTYHEKTIEKFYNRMVELRAAGYDIPNSVFLRIKREMRIKRS